MLNKKQWLWCAEHHKQINTTVVVVLSMLLFAYCYVFLERLWGQGKAPPVYSPKISQMDQFSCRTTEVNSMSISPSESTYKSDARPLRLEFHRSSAISSEVLDKRPECLGAFIADLQHYPDPYAILVVDRNTGKTIFRIARLQDYLVR